MKHARFGFAALIFFLLVPFAFSQDSIMVMDHKEIGPHERPLVRFPHEEHAGKIDCLQCHHDYDEYLNNKGGDGGACASCHGQVRKDGKPALLDAFHRQCKGCHEVMKQAGKATAPVMCGECHIRN